MPFILDNSVVMAWCFEETSTPEAYRILDDAGSDEIAVPAVWPLEFGNALLVAERRGRIRHADARRFVELVASLPITVHESGVARALGPILDLAHRYGLSTYDASYLELAIHEGMALATFDERLADAARQAGVPLIQ